MHALSHCVSCSALTSLTSNSPVCCHDYLVRVIECSLVLGLGGQSTAMCRIHLFLFCFYFILNIFFLLYLAIMQCLNRRRYVLLKGPEGPHGGILQI